jgi:biopolymer transport protein ExbB/TolQ
MAEGASATANVQHPASIVTQGTPVIMRTETTVPVPQPVINPYSFEFWTPILAFAMLVSGALALFSRSITGKIGDFKDAHKPLHDAIDGKLTDISHKMANDRQRIQILEQHRGQDIERIVKLETNLHNIEKSQERIENALEKMAVDLGNRIDHWSNALSSSIREVREVKPRI